MTVVTLYGKPQCPLCDDARTALERVRADLPFDLHERDITRDEGLHRAYFERIPVIALDGEELFDYFVDEAALRVRLSARTGPVISSAGPPEARRAAPPAAQSR